LVLVWTDWIPNFYSCKGELPMNNQEINRLSLITDSPLGEGKDFTDDGLEFAVYAQVIGNSILSTPGPFTIGIFGEWGTGKTSLLRMIERYLTKRGDGKILPIWFNAWRYEKDEHPVISLVGTIIKEIQLHNNFLDKLADKGGLLIRALRAIAYGFSAKSKVQIPGFAEIEAAFVAKDMIERSEMISSDPLLAKSLYYEAFESLSKIDLGEDRKIVVIIDDLDRCFPDQAIKLLESIKLILSQPGFIFVVGVSRNVIEGYLQHRYSKEYGIIGFDGSSYLDKIVQLPFSVPSHSGRMKKFSEKLLEKLDEENKKVLGEIIDIIAIACANNPRNTVRFINNLLIDQAINKLFARQEKSKYQEINIGFFAITRSLQLSWRDVYDKLIRSEALCKTITQWSKEKTLDKFIDKAEPDSETSRIALLLNNDTDLKDLLFSSAGQSWLADPDMREGTVQFLLIRQSQDEVILHVTNRTETEIGLLNNQIELLSLTDLPKQQAKQEWETILNQINEFEHRARKNLRDGLLGEEKADNFLVKLIKMRGDVVVQLEKLRD